MKSYLKNVLLLSLAVFVLSISLFAETSYKEKGVELEILSPNKKIKATIELEKIKNSDNSKVFFSVEYINKSEAIKVLPSSRLGLTRKDQIFTDNLRLLKVTEVRKIVDEYPLIHGKKKYCKNEGNEKTFSFVNSDNKRMDIIFRAYDNGVAFRYHFPDISDSVFKLTDESTTFFLPEGTKRWMQPYNSAYEDTYPLSINGMGPAANHQEWGFPALFEAKKQPYYVLISEANISRANCDTRLSNNKDLQQYKITMPEKEISFKLPWSSQWRVMIIGKLSDIVESTLITDLSEPSTITETDWIKPGPVSWIYWANNHGSKDYQKIVEYVDLAVKMHWPYVLIDWEWDQMGNGGKIEDAVAYANSKGIKPLMWYNSGDSSNLGGGLSPYGRLSTPFARAKEFSWLNKIGVFGIKVDFFDGDQQKVMNYYIDLMEDAAKYHLMINFHGATVPRGWDRTYPNLMSIEGVYGAEWYNNKPDMTHAAGRHNTTLPFTRNVIGPMDYTPVTFSNSQHPHITTYSHELALSVVFESGLQHFADRPEAYDSLPAAPKEFLQKVPVAWDDTKLIDGYPGEKVVMARKKGELWYIGGINGKDEAQKLSLDFKFLEHDKKLYTLEIIKDGLTDTSFATEKLTIKKGDVITVNCLPRGGFVAILK